MITAKSHLLEKSKGLTYLKTRKNTYRESLLQWIWANREFDSNKLKSVAGEEIEILDTGEWNNGEGPDFLGASLIIGGLQWHGSVEIHHNAGEWYTHGHHLDPNFDNTILHVILADAHKRAVTISGSEPSVLNLSHYLREALHKLIRVKNSRELSCAGNVVFLNQEAFRVQIEKAHREYFDYKVQEFLSMYDPTVTPSQAWKSCLTAAIYSALGIPGNRDAMAELYQSLRVKVRDSRPLCLDELKAAAAEIAFGPESGITWKRGGMRPAARPKQRILQAVSLHHSIANTSMKVFLDYGVNAWPMLLKSVPKSYRIGKQTGSLLEGTVFIPAIGLLGTLFHSKKLIEQAYFTWIEFDGAIPSEIKKPFREAGYALTPETVRPGLAHQYKRYCRERNCHMCEVFKSAIRS